MIQAESTGAIIEAKVAKSLARQSETLRIALIHQERAFFSADPAVGCVQCAP
jgi:hypothetical protein